MTALIAALLIYMPACGSGSSSTPSSSCPSNTDNVTVGNDVIVLPPSSTHLAGCQTLAPGTEVDAISGGKANTTFGTDAACTFTQLGSATPGAALKTAQVWSRDPVGNLYRMTNAQADCTLLSTNTQTHLCGMATVQVSGPPVQVVADCNNDPSVDVAVYRGGAVVRLDKSPATPFNVGAGQLLRVDPISGKTAIGPAAFSPEQIALFQVQVDALLSGRSFGDTNSLFLVKTLVPSTSILAPNALQGKLGPEYGVARSMCASAGTPAVFFPSNPAAANPQLVGSACGVTTARVYGLSIYKPSELFYRSGLFFQAASGALIRSEVFKAPLTLQPEASSKLFSWDGSVSSLPGASSAPKAIYVAKFIYSLPPDVTPHIGLLAISLAGAPYPSLG